MTCYSIGFYKEDGDFAILATLNNNNGHYSKSRINGIVKNMLKELEVDGENIIALERQDCEDCITIDEEAI